MGTLATIQNEIQNMSQDDIVTKLEDLEDNWGIKPGNEYTMSNTEISELISVNLISDDNFDNAMNKHKELVFSLGHMNVRLKSIGVIDASIANRFNRMYEILLYTKNFIESMQRMKIATQPGYNSTMNNDIAICRFRPIDLEETNPFQNLLLFLLHNLAINNLRKCGDRVMKAVYTREGEYTHAWESISTIQEYICNSISKELNWEQWRNLTSGKDFGKRASEHLEKHNDLEFPEVKKDRHVFAYKNGILNVNDTSDGVWQAKFYPFPCKLPPDLVACKYTDLDYPIGTPHTPNLDMILLYQKYTQNEIYWFYVFLGRLLFDVGERDGWQVMMYFKGQGGSGKSTITLKVCKNLYAAEDVEVISNNTERQFGLGSIYDTFLVVGPEIKNDFKLEQAEFQSMTSGESMNLAVKYKRPVSLEWKAPIVFAGNEIPGWVDNSGSLQRRIIVFQFNEIVRKGDTALGEKIKLEMPHILKRGAEAYIEAATKYGDKDIWNYIPSRFTDQKKAMAESTNSLAAFLASESVKLGDGLYCPQKEFIASYKSYCQDTGFKMNKWSQDTFAGQFADKDIAERKDARLEWPMNSGVKVHRSKWLMGVTLNYENAEDETHDGL